MSRTTAALREYDGEAEVYLVIDGDAHPFAAEHLDAVIRALTELRATLPDARPERFLADWPVTLEILSR